MLRIQGYEIIILVFIKKIFWYLFAIEFNPFLIMEFFKKRLDEFWVDKVNERISDIAFILSTKDKRTKTI